VTAEQFGAAEVVLHLSKQHVGNRNQEPLEALRTILADHLPDERRYKECHRTSIASYIQSCGRRQREFRRTHLRLESKKRSLQFARSSSDSKSDLSARNCRSANDIQATSKVSSSVVAQDESHTIKSSDGLSLFSTSALCGPKSSI